MWPNLVKFHHFLKKKKNKSLTILRGFMLNLQNFKSFLQLFVIFGKISLLLTEKY